MARLALIAACCLLVLVAVAPASAGLRMYLPESLGPVAGNPAERFAGRVIEQPHVWSTETTTRCVKKKQPGVDRFLRWYKKRFPRDRHRIGSRFRCDANGIGFSMHTENRAVDLAYNFRKRGQRRKGDRLIRLLLASDSAGNPAALARRMGIFEIIWNCGYWDDFNIRESRAYFQVYFMCSRSDPGMPMPRLSDTVAHVDHIHLSFTREGGAGRTTFWRPLDSIPFAPPPAPEEPAPEPQPQPQPQPQPEPEPEPQPAPDQGYEGGGHSEPVDEPPPPPPDCCPDGG